jgi:hypothetical protein
MFFFFLKQVMMVMQTKFATAGIRARRTSEVVTGQIQSAKQSYSSQGIYSDIMSKKLNRKKNVEIYTKTSLLEEPFYSDLRVAIRSSKGERTINFLCVEMRFIFCKMY